MNDDGVASLGQRADDGCADASAGAGDERYAGLIGEDSGRFGHCADNRLD